MCLEVYDEVEKSIYNIKKVLRGVPNNGIGYGILFGYNKNNLPKVIFNYLGQFGGENQIEQCAWKFIEKNYDITAKDPANQSDDLLTINAYVINGILKLNIISILNNDHTTKFTRSLKRNLENIINYIIQKECIEYISMQEFNDFTPSLLINKTSENTNNKKLFVLPPGNGGAESYLNSIVPYLSDLDLVLFNNYYLYLQDHFLEDNKGTINI